MSVQTTMGAAPPFPASGLIRPIGRASCGVLAWRYRGQLRVTAIVKATFSFVPGGDMKLEPPDDVYAADVPWGDLRSPWAVSDLIPFRLLADVVMVGHARLPPGGGEVRLAVIGKETLVDRRLAVSDDAGDGAPVPLAYERAFGGVGSADNPVGTGLAAGSALPSVIDVASPRAAGSFGPVPRSWPARRKLLGKLDPAVLELPIADIPGNFDWAYFQAAPPGQLTDFLRGDEWVEIAGTSREHPALRSRLPGAVGAGQVHGLPGTRGPVPIVFRADNLHVDADRLRCSLTYRASFSVPGEEALAGLLILAGVEIGGQRIHWPERPAPAPPPRPPAPPPAAAVDDEDSQLEVATLPFTSGEPGRQGGRQGTIVLEWSVATADDPSAAPSEPGEGGPPPAGRQPTMVLEAEGPPPAGRQPTMVLEAEGPPPAGRQPTMLLEASGSPSAGRHPTMVLEAEGPPPAGRQTTMLLDWSEGGGGDEHPLMGTIPFGPDHLPVPMATPFRLSEPGAPRAAPAPAVPGAPWSAHRAAPVPRAFGAEVTRSLVLAPDLVIPDDLLGDGAPRAVPRPAPAPPFLAGGDPQTPAAGAAVAGPPAPPPRAIPRPAVRSSVRKRFPARKR